METIAQGAEATLTRDGDALIKERIKKEYRLAELDTKLRASRTRREAKLLGEARRAGIDAPKVTEVSDYTIKMEFIDGQKVRDVLNKENCAEMADKIGRIVAKLHDSNLIHGDLTTSNMIFLDSKVWFIDFGLGFHSQRIEDKAVDIHLLKQVLTATHYECAEEFWAAFLAAYNSYTDADKVIKTLRLIERRGRYRKRQGA